MLKRLINTIVNFVKGNPSVFLLLIISLLLCVTNYVPNTFLTGWDTLHPEFNYQVYWSRIIDGAWQTHQGLGDVATQAHASEIPRIVILMLFSLFLKVSQVRYAYAFLMLIIGPLGVYAFLKKIFLKSWLPKQQEIGAFAGGLFYLLNVGILQHFYVPLEMFLTHYGFLGWFFLYVCEYIDKPNKNSLLKFCIVCLLSTSQAHTATLFYSMMLCFGVFLLVLFLMQRMASYANYQIGNHKLSLKQGLLLLVLPLLINSFWLLPNIYFTVSQGENIQKSKIHSLFSEEAFLQNKKFSDINDIALLRGFLFNWGQYVGNNRFGDLLGVWKHHLANPFVLPIGYLLFFLVLLGLVKSLTRKEKYALPVFAIFFACIFFLLNANPPFGFVFTLLQAYVPLFKEALRFPFTKFSILLVFTYAIFFGYAISYLATALELIVSKKLQHLLKLSVNSGLVFYPLIVITLVFYMLPAFSGNFISSTMKVDIPHRYFEMFDYFNKQSDYGRVAELPIHSFWGWIYYDWNPINYTGYQGAGFLWFGIRQPLLDREFDRWGLPNEQYYHEMSHAVYAQDILLLENVLEKYKVKWILLDKSVMAPGADSTVLFYSQIDTLLKSSNEISLDKDFGDGLFVYKVNLESKGVQREISSNYREVGKPFFKETSDIVYSSSVPYIETKTDYFPFVSITNTDESINRNLIYSDETTTYFKPNINSGKLTGDYFNDTFQFETLLKDVGNKNIEVTLIDSSGVLNYISTKKLLPKPNTESFVLKVGNNIFYVNSSDISTSERNLGISIINPTLLSNITVYDVVLGHPVTFDYKSALEVCSQVANLGSYTVENVQDGFKLSSKGAIGCVTSKLSNFLNSPIVGSDIILVKATTESMSSTPAICLFETSTGLCKNTPLKNGVSISLIPSTGINDFYLRFSSGNATDKSSEFGITYKDIYVTFPKPIFTEKLSFDTVLSNPIEVSASQFAFKKLDYLAGSVVDIFHTSRSCQTGQIDLDKGTIEVAGRDFISYKSTKDSLCDSSELPLLSHNMGYVLEVVSRNRGGLPLRLCLTNEYSKRCDLYISLGKNKDFTSQYYFISPIDSESGYTINLSNMVFGDTPGKNDIKYISVTPIPYNYLRSLHSVSIPEVKGGKLLIYNQSYENGWLALCGYRICNAKHVKVNNWANGWVFDDPNVDISNVKIVFWPQILEYLGFLLVGGTLMYVTFYKRSHE